MISPLSKYLEYRRRVPRPKSLTDVKPIVRGVMKQRFWRVSFSYRNKKNHYRSNGTVYVFADSFEEAADTVKSTLPQLNECIDVNIYSVIHEGDKTILISDNAMNTWRESLIPKSDGES